MRNVKLLITHAHYSRVNRGQDCEEQSSQVLCALKFLINYKIRFLFENVLKLNFLLHLDRTILEDLVL